METIAISRKVLQWYKKQAAEDFARRLEIFLQSWGLRCRNC